MSNAIAHVLKYKLEDGTWVQIPVLFGDIYTAYVEYCAKHKIEPVDQTTYYQTLGSLKELVDEFAGNSENIKAVAEALSGGVLPSNKGGLGVSIGDGCDYPTLQAALVSLASVALTTDLAAINTSVAQKMDKAAFASGTDDPNDADLSEDVIYYFQYKEE